ncbi:MAG: hypothetical protein EOM91_19725 [Sphingobacteriia bacterium]|nr:hypothetical protein [Sphingobacteriia bacterium]NCC41414.1 hypothetical protein [Gammaproteobacteria bacterium]
MTDPPAPLVVIGDLHVHLELFERLLERIDHEAPDAYIVTLGDYVDNGPQIPELLDCLIELLEARPGRFRPILDPTWERIVVSSHTYLPGQPFFSAPRRICVSATADHGGGLYAILLPERRGWWTDGRAVSAVG